MATSIKRFFYCFALVLTIYTRITSQYGIIPQRLTKVEPNARKPIEIVERCKRYPVRMRCYWINLNFSFNL